MTPVTLVRTVDELGRVVVPAEIRRQLNTSTGDGMEILVNGEDIILRKWEPKSVFRGATGELAGFMGRRLCLDYIQALREPIGNGR